MVQEREEKRHQLFTVIRKYPNVQEAFDQWKSNSGQDFSLDSANKFLRLYGFSVSYHPDEEVAKLSLFLLGKKLVVATIPLRRGMEYVDIIDRGFKFIEEFNAKGIVYLTMAGNNIWIGNDSNPSLASNADCIGVTDSGKQD